MPVEYMRRGDGTVGTIPQNVPIHVNGLGATSASQVVFIADGYYEVVGVKEAHGVAGGAASAVTVEKLTGTTASGSGTAMLTATIALNGTANTVLSGTLVATKATLRVAAGDRIGIVLSGTLTGLANCNVSIALKRLKFADRDV